MLGLLHARVADAQIVATGKTLTVTTTNAVATFNGPDLVGFANSLTSEMYLKKPSNGDLVQVDAITSTGQGLQTSNWTIGTESGTGSPLATIMAQDSIRTITMTVKIDPASQEIVLHSSASVTSGGVRGASWSIAGLDLADGRWIVPANSGAVFNATNLGVNAYIEYPTSWQAQMAVYEAAAGSLLLYSTDSQYLFKRLRQTTRGDSTLDVTVYTEASAPWPSATTVPTVEWRMKAFAGGWRTAAAPYREWMLGNRPPVSNAAHPWVSTIRSVVAVGALDSTILAPLAAQLNPAQTLLYLVNWRQSNYDVNYPDYTPVAGAANFVTAAHALGFKVMLHTDILGVAPTNPDYATVQQYQTRTPETLQLMGWNWDQTTVPNRYGLIDPASSAYRALWIARIGVAINLLHPDALHLDFTAMDNDGNGPIEGRTFPQGEDYFNQQIIAAFPNVALGSEEEFDFTYRYHSFAQMGFWAFQSAGHPITNFLFNPQVEYYGHLATPQVTDPAFKRVLMQQMQIGAFPLWWIYSPSFIDTTTPDIARFIRMAQSWQNNGFQPAWTEDWTGALIRYQGVGGATATLTDSGGLFTLQSAQSTLFTLAHDSNQVTVGGSFINKWAAFDASTLYGLDPAVLYYVDPGARPDATHATSLPPGVRVGAGTLVTPSFAHVELAPPALFDFTNLSNARVGLTYQGVDYPLAYGATVYETTDTVGGVARSGLFIHPPYQGSIGGETFVEYSVPLPAGATLQFSVGINDGATCTDGVTFRVTADGTEIWRQNYGLGAWHDTALSLAAYAGRTIPLRLISNPGPAGNPSCDWSAWSEVAIVAPTPAVSVPMTLASGSTFSAIDGASYTPTSSSTGTVDAAAVPGGFTIFTQPGQSIASGTNIATLPFDLWRWDKDGTTPQPGGVYGAGTVGPRTAGGVTKNPAIFAHPPNASRTVLSWALRLPSAGPLQLGWSAGVTDGAYSDDGVAFSVLVNGNPYWTLTTGVHGDNHWTSGVLNLARWQGQSILVELVTDSLADNNYDWAAWADLVLSASSVSCAYAVPASASIGSFGGSFSATVTAPATCSWLASSNVPWLTVTSGSGAGNGSVMYIVAPNAGDRRTGTLTIGGQTLTITQDPSPPTMMLDRSSLVFTAVNTGAGFTAVTSAQTVRMTQSVSGTVTWTAASNKPWLIVSPTSGTGSATLTVSTQFSGGLTKTQSGSITITLTGAGDLVGPITVTLKTIDPPDVQPPFGSFDTPTNNSTGVAGSIPVTGWALDAVQVTRVTVCRDAVSGDKTPVVVDPNCAGNAQIYIGDAVFIDGARTDVHAAYLTLPLSSRAGWGYLLLTNFLPNLGNGTFNLRAYAFSAEGRTTALGVKTITCDNADSFAPFGAIDTPGQGEVISGAAYANFGWVLAQSPNFADPPDGGTVKVFVDGHNLGSPGGWTTRSDLQALFGPPSVPALQYPGIGNALGVFGLDTTTLANGLHAIAWSVTDSVGVTSGIGSRFITVSNGAELVHPPAATASSQVATSSQATTVISSRSTLDIPAAASARIVPGPTLTSEIAAAPPDLSTVQGRRGFDLDLPLRTYTPSSGAIDVQAEELDRIELHLSSTGHPQYSGYLQTAAGLRPLPVGSSLDAWTGTFTWMPGVGFYGTYHLTFVRWSGATAVSRQDVRITLNAKGSNRVGPQTIIDAPTAGASVGSPFFVGGWAADLDSTVDTGVNAVHVWAYPLDGRGNRLDPIFIGPSYYGGARPDVAAVYGDRFGNSGYGIIVNGLPPGTYDIAVFAFSTVVNTFTPARIVRVTVR
jgi:hypothetical protein